MSWVQLPAGSHHPAGSEPAGNKYIIQYNMANENTTLPYEDRGKSATWAANYHAKNLSGENEDRRAATIIKIREMQVAWVNNSRGSVGEILIRIAGLTGIPPEDILNPLNDPEDLFEKNSY